MKPAAIRGYLIDSEHGTVVEVAGAFNDYREICRVLGCRTYTTGSRPLCGGLSQGFDAIYASDDVLEDRDAPRFWFQVDADRNPPSSFPIAGNGLVLGTDPEGEACDVKVALDEVRARVTFTRRKFRGLEIHTRSEDGAVEVAVNAPIIDDGGIRSTRRY